MGGKDWINEHEQNGITITQFVCHGPNTATSLWRFSSTPVLLELENPGFVLLLPLSSQ